ncbi:DUF368 domain-containing protein [Salicola sp. Rm-C-2C1-2]|uniref:DUF368 domain-containing protein n=1 Tax=Salicola sp. Rm-C-2C1-2 TaxID=3141321 RepID=UPI0032E3791C
MSNEGAQSAPGIILRGCLMGAADIVPGVSGGTMALITGIYQRLLAALGHIPEAGVTLVRQRSPVMAWKTMDAGFLVMLLGGILFSVVTLAHGIGTLLDDHPMLVRAFFSGLIVGAVIHVGRQVPLWSSAAGFGLVVGALVAWSIAQLTPATLALTPMVAFGAGFVAISAMVLPGISGSFILLLLGLYEPILDAIREPSLAILAIFAGGCALGLVAMARLVATTLARFPSVTLAVLTGFMVGSLTNLWPWKKVVAWRNRSAGDAEPLLYENLAPWHYAEVTGGEPQTVMVVSLAGLGFGLIVLVEWLGKADGSKR